VKRHAGVAMVHDPPLSAYIISMALLKIARMGHPVLIRPARPVADPTAADVRTLVRDMIDTMIDADGVGLAAPQVHVPLRIIVFRIPAAAGAGDDREAEHEEQDDGPPTVIINPTVEVLDDARETDFEGCLSIPGLRGVVTRPANIRYRGVDLEGRSIEEEAHGGLHARVVQHEVDHLDGILYPMRMSDLSLLGFSSEVGRHIEALVEAAETRPEE
jgi:peptide deformylase